MREQRIGDIAIEAIDQIIEREGIFVSEEIAKATSYHIARNADFSTVMQYLWTFVGNGAPKRRSNNRARYRIERYLYALSQVQLGQERIQHIDLGCGGGTFAHALLELIGVEFDKVTLYGYDHAPEMIKAARMIHGLIQNWHTGDIPNLNAYDDYGLMLEEIPASPREPTHYIITAGYVLAGNNNDQTIGDLTSIIAEVVRKADNDPCSLVVRDANTVGELAPAYNRLVENLQVSGINVQTQASTLNSNDMRIARLHRQGG